MDVRWAPGNIDLMRTFAKELVSLQPDVILTQSTPVTAALKRETSTIPIVFAAVADPVGSGFVASLPRPGGNVTGFSSLDQGSMASKWLELLTKIAPSVKRAVMMFNPDTAPYMKSFLPLREVVWVILAHFRKAAFCCCSRCGHVGNALALSIMSTAMLASPPSRSVQ